MNQVTSTMEGGEREREREGESKGESKLLYKVNLKCIILVVIL